MTGKKSIPSAVLLLFDGRAHINLDEAKLIDGESDLFQSHLEEGRFDIVRILQTLLEYFERDARAKNKKGTLVQMMAAHGAELSDKRGMLGHCRHRMNCFLTDRTTSSRTSFLFPPACYF